jgi:redox-sensing transcriptional repressor
MNQHAGSIPASVVTRLTKYLAYGQGLCSSGVQWVSSQELAQNLGLTSSTVRQDLTHVDFHGISKRGYETHGLVRVLGRMFGADQTWKAIVVGAGNLGQALARHEEFQRRGFDICGIFDSDEKKSGRKVGRLVVRGLHDVPSFVGESGAQIGMVAVPAVAAQSVADLLVVSGIKGVLNLSLAHLVVPQHVAVIDSRIIASLLELAHAIRSLPAAPPPVPGATPVESNR